MQCGVSVSKERPQNKHLKSWKKGESGNPKGRAKGTKNWSTRIKAILDKKPDAIFTKEEIKKYNLEDEDLTLRDAVIVRQAQAAIENSDSRSAQFLADREDGKSVQPIAARIDHTISEPWDQDILDFKYENDLMTAKEISEYEEAQDDSKT